VPRDCEAEARPADETAEAEQGQRSAFCKPAATGAAKAGNRNHQGEGISVPRMRAEMGSPWSVSFFDTLYYFLSGFSGSIRWVERYSRGETPWTFLKAREKCS